MSWFKKGFRSISVIATGVGIGSAAWFTMDKESKTFTEKFTSPLNKVLASYTTNFEPSVKWDHNWDRRDPKSIVKPPKDGKEEDYQNMLKKATPTASRHLILIRHGQYNLQGKGDENRYLTELGKKQVALTGKRLKELNHNYDVLISSTMTRAKESADIISKQLDPKIPRKYCDLLREGAPYPPEPPVGDWKPEAYTEYVDNARIEAAFRKHFYRASPRQKQDTYEVLFFEDGARIEAAFRKYFHRADYDQQQDSHEVIVFHANVIRYFICRALQVPPEAWLRLSLHNASMTMVTIRPSGRVAVRGVGDAGHLPTDHLTFN